MIEGDTQTCRASTAVLGDVPHAVLRSLCCACAGLVNVEDLIPLLGAYGKSGAAAGKYDIVKTGASNGKVDVEDLLLLLKSYGATNCMKPGAPAPPPAGKTINVQWSIKSYAPMTANVGDTVSFTWGGTHDVHLHPSGTCSQAGATLVASSSQQSGKYTFTKPGKYTFACQVGRHCNMGQIVTFTVGGASSGGIPSGCTSWYDGCNTCGVAGGVKGMCTKMACLRQGTPFCQAYASGKTCTSPTSCTGGSTSPPPPPPPCAQGSLCGGQVQVSCGTSCPFICGQPPRMMCNRMCFRGIQCPRGQWWDGGAGQCVPDQNSCSGMGR